MNWLRNKLAKFIYDLWFEEKLRRRESANVVVNVRADTRAATEGLAQMLSQLDALRARTTKGPY